MAEPSEFTKESMHHWNSHYQLSDVVTAKVTRNVSGIAAGMAELDFDEHTLLEFVDEMYPKDENVVTMRGENTARLYVVNHHPHAGLKRHKIHRGHALRQASTGLP